MESLKRGGPGHSVAPGATLGKRMGKLNSSGRDGIPIAPHASHCQRWAWHGHWAGEAKVRGHSLYFLCPSPKSPPTVRVAVSVKYSIINWSQNAF